jgi:hypothetical protein
MENMKRGKLENVNSEKGNLKNDNSEKVISGKGQL